MQEQDTNNYWEQLERLEKLIRASELKAGVIFSYHSLILGLFLDRLNYFESVFEGSKLLIIFALCWVLLVFISIFFCFKCFQPKMELKYRKNVFFFRDAALRFGNIEEYGKKWMQVCQTNDEIIEPLSDQIHVESKIVNQKFRDVQKAIIFFAASFIIIIQTLVFWFINL